MGLLMKCANCNADALYVYRITFSKSVYYCGKDLPKFLDDRKKAGLLKLTDQFKVEYDSAIEILKPTVVEEQVVEEPVQEKAPAKKKASTKKAK